MTPEVFPDFLHALQRMDPAAWNQLVESFDEPMRRRVRAYIKDHDLRREVDTLDALHSGIARVLKKGIDQFQFDDLQDIRKLILTVTLNRLRDRARRPRPDRQEETGEGREPSPSQQVAVRDCLEEIQQRLRPETWKLFLWKEVEGLSWEQIVQRRGQAPETLHALQTSYRRDIRRVLEALELSQE
jgi:DNA-directed RNA polymerase specialized sigma24 family protein